MRGDQTSGKAESRVRRRFEQEECRRAEGRRCDGGAGPRSGKLTLLHREGQHARIAAVTDVLFGAAATTCLRAGASPRHGWFSSC